MARRGGSAVARGAGHRAANTLLDLRCLDGTPGLVENVHPPAVPGAYLRVLTSGDIQAGDPIGIEFRPDHRATVGMMFRTLMIEPDRLGQLTRVDRQLSAASPVTLYDLVCPFDGVRHLPLVMPAQGVVV